MGIGGIGIWQLLIVLVIVMVIFGTSRLKSFGGDLGSAVRGFRQSMSGDAETEPQKSEDPSQPQVVKSEASEDHSKKPEYNNTESKNKPT
tara:strand:- start:270 stop:539 length:270 start_codon:yes stop_codon:yes gene_type:complete